MTKQTVAFSNFSHASKMAALITEFTARGTRYFDSISGIWGMKMGEI
jgi:hypothetical protein